MRRTKGIAALITGALLMAACGPKNNTLDSAKAIGQQEADAGYSMGRVTTAFAEEACPVLVKLDDVSGTFLIPIALEERFKKNGLHLRFKYRPSRANNGGCMKGQTAILEEVSVAPEK
jgi:hypothetical protein